MVLYKSATSRTVVSGRYQINNDPGILLDVADAELDALVKDGVLTSEAFVLEVEEVVLVKKTEPVKPIVSK